MDAERNPKKHRPNAAQIVVPGVIGTVVVSTTTCLLFWIACSRYFEHGFFDDSFISLRYVQNLVEGHGLVWNVGDSPVEGFTNLAWIFLLAIFNTSDCEALELAARNAGVVLGLGTILLSLLATRSLLPFRSRSLAGIVPLHLALSPLFCRHAISGMETMMTCFLVSAISFMWLMDDSQKQLPAYWVSLAILTFLAILTRPDTLLFGATGTIALLTAMRMHGAKVYKQIVCWSSTLLALVAVLVIWKYVYFGSIIPLPAYMKCRIDRLFGSPRLVIFILGHWLGFARVVAPFLLITFLAAATGRVPKPGVVWPLCVGVGSYGLYFLTVLPIMSLHWRYLFPLYAPLAVVAAGCLVAIVSREFNPVAFKEKPRCHRIGRIAAFLLFAAYNVGDFHETKMACNAMYQAHVPYGLVGKTLKGIPGISVSLSEVGQFAYYSRCRVLDLSGLNDAFIARNRFSDLAFPDKFESYLSAFGLPDVYIEPPDEYEYAILAKHPRLLPRYDKIYVCGLTIYVLKQSKSRETLLCRLQGNLKRTRQVQHHIQIRREAIS